MYVELEMFVFDGKLEDRSFRKIINEFEKMGFRKDKFGAFICDRYNSIGKVMEVIEETIETNARKGTGQPKVVATVYYGKGVGEDVEADVPVEHSITGFFEVNK